MSRKREIQQEVNYLVKVLEGSRTHIKTADFGIKLGYNLNVTKEYAKLKARIRKARLILASRGLVLANHPKKGYIVTEDKNLIFGESVKSLGRTMGGLITFNILLGKSGQSSLIDFDSNCEIIRELKSDYLKLYSKAVEMNINLKSKPEFISNEEKSVDQAMS